MRCATGYDDGGHIDLVRVPCSRNAINNYAALFQQRTEQVSRKLCRILDGQGERIARVVNGNSSGERDLGGARLSRNRQPPWAGGRWSRHDAVFYVITGNK